LNRFDPKATSILARSCTRAALTALLLFDSILRFLAKVVSFHDAFGVLTDEG
jgi:hypothetical protein